MGLFTDVCRCTHSILDHETGGRCRKVMGDQDAGALVCPCRAYHDAAQAPPVPRVAGTVTEEETRVLQCVKRWLRTREGAGKTAAPHWTQFAADVDHSALLRRLLAGKDPLPLPPPRNCSQPWYSLIEDGEGWALELVRQQPDRPGVPFMVAVAQDAGWVVVNQPSATTYRLRYVAHEPGGPVWLATCEPLPITSVVVPPPVVMGWHLVREG